MSFRITHLADYTSKVYHAYMDKGRRQRGLSIVDGGGVQQIPDRPGWWRVLSQSGRGTYLVELPTDGRAPHCSCLDFEKPEVHFCKHIIAAEMEQGRLFVAVEEQAKFVDHRDWSVVNQAHMREKEYVLRFAYELTRGIEETPQGRGRPRVPLRDVVLGALLWVHGTQASRSSSYEFDRAQEEGLLSRRLHYSSLLRHLQNPAITDIMRHLVRESALPMKHVERRFAVDATGFSTSTYERWFDHKWGKQVKGNRLWLKAHAICGVDTKIVTDCTIADVGDATKFKELVDNTATHFRVDEVSADGAYASVANAQAAVDVGAVPYIPVEARIRDNHGPECWRQMVGCYRYREPEFRRHYHQRSKIETVFSMVKKKFGGHVRCKKRVAQENELLAKFILHNFRVVTMGFFALGEDDRFLRGMEAAS